MLQDAPDITGVSNHPRALWMAVIAFINYNITVACVWGTFSVLLGAVETRLGVGRDLSTMAAPAVNLSTAICALLAGVLAARYSLRLIMLAGSMLSVAGFAMLALTASYPLYLLAFGLLLGPGMAVGIILPGTLVTRWFRVNRGRALGVVSTPVIVAVVPLASTWMLQAHGLSMTYAALAALSVVSVIGNLFVIDHPPADEAKPAAGTQGTQAGAQGIAMAQLMRSPRFWALMFTFIASTTGSIVLTAHMVPMARNWGFSATLAATLLSIQSLVGIAGTTLFGWLADRLGAVLVLAIVVFDGAVLWMLLLLHPPFAAVAVIVGLIGLHGAGAGPVLGLALSETFGRESFSRAFGLVNLINLPFSVLCVPAAAMVYTHTGSYAGAIIGVAVFLLLTSIPALSTWQWRTKAVA